MTKEEVKEKMTAFAEELEAEGLPEPLDVQTALAVSTPGGTEVKLVLSLQTGSAVESPEQPIE